MGRGVSPSCCSRIIATCHTRHPSARTKASIGQLVLRYPFSQYPASSHTTPLSGLQVCAMFHLREEGTVRLWRCRAHQQGLRALLVGAGKLFRRSVFLVTLCDLTIWPPFPLCPCEYTASGFFYLNSSSQPAACIFIKCSKSDRRWTPIDLPRIAKATHTPPQSFGFLFYSRC